jgi:hypothetical protein
MKKIVLILSFFCCMFFVGRAAFAQAPVYYGALLYSMPRDTSVPPIYSGQPSQVTTAYLWLDDAMRLFSESILDKFINTFSWNDTAKTVASNLYQLEDDNPLSFYMWSGKAIKPNPYKGDPGHDRVLIENRVLSLAGDSGRTYTLLATDVIADVRVTDTSCTIDTTDGDATPMVLVNCTLLDPIKGKHLPACPGQTNTKFRGSQPLNTPTQPYSTYADTAAVGTCLQFEYSPEWQRTLTDEYRMRTRLIDSLGGWWVKPSHEYIVFLSFIGFGADSTKGYFSVFPGSTVIGTSGGMYPVIGGIVQDPNDDFGLGSTHLTVSQWKSRLRARIHTLVNP